ncbi:uncharacterized protein LOC126367050 [Pectinophora gossypiella]|uniref:uncharacterized protein LOC126367050 n=1 Tax=Pectinophora gossypiella TaxID=13191 RepID=UPI00214E7542|nr:uncharacterized protein LOC126367050 [Pectinophora gossypiella]
MKGILIITITLALTNVLAYHDPDLNYHLSQLQKIQPCDERGYSYPAPSIQLTTGGVKPASVVAQPVLSAPSYQYSQASGYSSAVAPQLSYATQPALNYQAVVSHAGYASAPAYSTQINQIQTQQKEVHGYATSAGLSSAATRTVIPQATYAQAPILAKITGAPLIAKFDISPAKTTYVTQNLAAQKASVNSYSSVQHGGPVVTQLYAAPSAQYAASPNLKVQQIHQQGQAQYATSVSHVSAGNAVQYSGASVQYSAPAVTQYAAPQVTQYATPAVQYGAPVVTNHHTQYSTPVVVQQYAAPAANHYQQYQPAVATTVVKSAPVSHYSAPAISRYASVSSGVQYAAPSVSHIAAPAVAHLAAPSVAHVAAPAVQVAPSYRLAAGHAKNAHTEFLENYDSHPRYAYEYSVNDPHTGDIKQQKEERDGEVVKGQYSLVEPDGSVRTVKYVADWETGFHADVRNSKDNQH